MYSQRPPLVRSIPSVSFLVAVILFLCLLSGKMIDLLPCLSQAHRPLATNERWLGAQTAVRSVFDRVYKRLSLPPHPHPSAAFLVSLADEHANVTLVNVHVLAWKCSERNDPHTHNDNSGFCAMREHGFASSLVEATYLALRLFAVFNPYAVACCAQSLCVTALVRHGAGTCVLCT